MKLRVLEYFLALTREGSISAAAKALHVSQPTLSRQLRDLENELDCILFERSKHGITLTEDGLTLRRRAGEISQLVSATEEELQLSHNTVAGSISIGCAETPAIAHLAHFMKEFRDRYPKVTYNMVTDTAENVTEKINKGLLDFGFLLRQTQTEGLHYIPLNYEDQPAILVPDDYPLARQHHCKLSDIQDLPLIIPATYQYSGILGILGDAAQRKTLNIVATYTLIYNAARMAEQGLGAVITLQNLYSQSVTSPLVEVPIVDARPLKSYLAWKPFRFNSSACKVFLEEAQRAFADNSNS